MKLKDELTKKEFDYYSQIISFNCSRSNLFSKLSVLFMIIFFLAVGYILHDRLSKINLIIFTGVYINVMMILHKFHRQITMSSVIIQKMQKINLDQESKLNNKDKK